MAKNTCEASCRIEMTWLRKHHYLNGYAGGLITWTSTWGSKSSAYVWVNTEDIPLYIQFAYTTTVDDKKTDYNYKIDLTSTPCRFGGKRYWFLCRHCGRRVGILYLNRVAACRKCHLLAYESQQRSHYGRWGILGKFLNLEMYVEEKTSKMRIKFWKKRPTKRYMRVLRKQEQLYTQARSVKQHDWY